MKRDKPIKEIVPTHPPRLTKQAARILLKILRGSDEPGASVETTEEDAELIRARRRSSADY